MGNASQSTDVEKGGVSRRAFLKKAGLAAGALMAANVAGVAYADSALPGSGAISRIKESTGANGNSSSGESSTADGLVPGSASYYPTLVKQYFGTQGVYYEPIDELMLRVPFSTDNMPNGIGVVVVFDEDAEPFVLLRNWELGSFPDTDQRAQAISLCNDLNNEYRWVKFSIDSDNDVTAQIDAMIDETSCGAEVEQLVQYMAVLCDLVYPRFAAIQ